MCAQSLDQFMIYLNEFIFLISTAIQNRVSYMFKWVVQK